MWTQDELLTYLVTASGVRLTVPATVASTIRNIRGACKWESNYLLLIAIFGLFAVRDIRGIQEMALRTFGPVSDHFGLGVAANRPTHHCAAVWTKTGFDTLVKRDGTLQFFSIFLGVAARYNC